MLQAGCTNTISNTGDLVNCTYLFENLGYHYGQSGSQGYWLENVSSTTFHDATNISAEYLSVGFTTVDETYYNMGVRPVIEVLESNISS